MIKLGDSVKVEQEVFDPYLKKFVISGWQGRITFFYPHNNSMLIKIAWDSLTLKQLPIEFIKSYIKNKWGYALTYIKMEDVELSQPRDSLIEVENLVEKMDKDYDYESYSEQEKRVSKIFPSLEISVNKKNLKIYFEYLQKKLSKPIILTGLSDTPIDLLYFIGYKPQSSKVFKSEIPSIKDKFKFIELVEDFDEENGFYTIVERINDKKKFKLVLWELICIDENSKNYELIDDYSNWVMTYSQQPPKIQSATKIK